MLSWSLKLASGFALHRVLGEFLELWFGVCLRVSVIALPETLVKYVRRP